MDELKWYEKIPTRFLYNIVVFGGFFFLMTYVFYHHVSLKRDLEENGDTTVCRIIAKDPYLVFSYSAKGVIRQTKRVVPPFRTYRIGEFYKCIYDHRDPSRLNILFHLPTIVVEEEYRTTKLTSPIRKDKLNDNSIEFKYQIDGKEYSRGQLVSPNYDHIDETKQYMVKYNVNDPKIAYLLIE
jgi:hypothetical protein